MTVAYTTSRGVTPSRRGPAADVTVVASAADLYLLVWRRADPTSEPFQISGDAT